MQYAGGKARIAKPIAAFLEGIRTPGQLYIEPFVGAANVLSLMSGPRQAFDAHPDLILLWQAIQSGWAPPLEVSEELHCKLRQAPPSALRGFAGFACSYGAKFFGSYARNKEGEDYAAPCARSLARKSALLAGVPFTRQSYDSLNVRGALIYCDPPYAGTMGFKGAGRFDISEFWETVRRWSAHNTVIVSEQTAPPDFEPALTLVAPRSLIKGQSPRVEYLFRLRRPAVDIAAQALCPPAIQSSSTSQVQPSSSPPKPAC